MQGILFVDKPVNWTSFDVVNYVRKIIAAGDGVKPKSIKVGHTGTLDPFATGLLILLIGKNYTRRAAELSKLDKTYDVLIKLGETSSTGDPEGQLTRNAATVPSREQIQQVLKQFVGVIQQVPPVFSAIKVNGQRAYDLARKGQPVALQARNVTIHSLELVSYVYPELRLITRVSSGTYVRTLAEDIGVRLGTGAYTTQLRRTSIGPYDLRQSCVVEGLTAQLIQARLNTF